MKPNALAQHIIIAAMAFISPHIALGTDGRVESAVAASGETVGLVLSGGGAKGVAHIGVIQALEDNDIPIDCVAGTSMGAIVGGLYACGYTPAEMMNLLLSEEFALWSTGQIDPTLTYYFLERPHTPAFAHLSISSGNGKSRTSSGLLPQSLISPLPMNFAFMELFAAYTAQCRGDFNRLFVPFRCVASDVTHKHKVVFANGHLSDAIRASMSFPIVFHPIKINGVEMYDGGIYDNFPVDVMHNVFHPSVMIGVDVHAEDSVPSNSIMSQLENMIIQNNNYDLPPDEGIRIHVDVSRFGLLEFDKAREIYEIGYRRGLEMIDSIKSRVAARTPAESVKRRRDAYKASLPPVQFSSAHVAGGTKQQDAYLTNLFESSKHHADTFGISQARLAYYRALTPGRLNNLIPHADFDSVSGLFDLNLQADVKSNLSLGAGVYLTSSTNSMIFVSASYSTMAQKSWTTSLMGWIGQSYLAAQADVQMLFSHTRPSAIELQAAISRKRYYESNRFFYEDNAPDFVTHTEMFGRLSYAYAPGRRARLSIGLGGGRSQFRFNTDDMPFDGSETTRMNLAQAIVRFDYNTLDNPSFPTDGTSLRITAMQTLGRFNSRLTRTDMPGSDNFFTQSQHWLQAEIDASHFFALGKHFALGASADILFSNRPLLNTYSASVVNAPAYTPFASMRDVFNKAFHANSFIAAGLTPVWRPFRRAQVRLGVHAFLPFRKILPVYTGTYGTPLPLATPEYGRWFAHPEFIGELDLVYNLPFASICGYVDYLSSPRSNWNVGLSFGLYFTAARFLR